MLMALRTSIKTQKLHGEDMEDLLLRSPTCRVPCAEVGPAHTSKGCKTGPGTAVAQARSHRTHLSNQVSLMARLFLLLLRVFGSDGHSKAEIVSCWDPGSCRISLFHIKSTPVIAS